MIIRFFVIVWIKERFINAKILIEISTDTKINIIIKI